MKINIKQSPDFLLVSIQVAKLSRFNRAIKALKKAIPSRLRRYDPDLRAWCISRQAKSELDNWLSTYYNAEIIKERIEWNWYLDQKPDSELRRAVELFREKSRAANPPIKKKTDLTPRLVKAVVPAVA